MAAPHHNQNARKWTAETVLSALSEIEKDIDSLYLGSALLRLRISPKAWGHWRKIFHDHDEISYRMELIELHYECKLVEGALRGEIRGSNANFVLKHRYGWGNDAKPAQNTSGTVAPRDPAIIKMADGRIISLP